MNIDELQGLLRPALDIAHKAGEEILKIYQTEFSVDMKQDDSPLTAADLAAHHCIVQGLSEASDYPVLSEESASIPFAQRAGWDRYWLVDPLDGTKEFVKRNGDFTVNIALIHQHQPVLGVVYVPVSGQCYFAAEGLGAFKQTAGIKPIKIQIRKRRAGQPLIVVGSRSHKTHELQQYLDNLPEHELLSIGSSLKFCLVAEGSADLYPRLGLTSEWDTAAAQCVVEQAGGAVVQTDGKTLQYNRKECLLNPYFLVFGDKEHDWTQYLPPSG